MTNMFGFVILSHRSSRQLHRLCMVLGALYDEPPIAVHHDIYQSPIDQAAFPSNVHFVSPPIATGWAKWSLVEATLRAIDLLYQFSDPEYFYLLSAADYPIARSRDVLCDLQNAETDALIDAFPLQEALEGQPLYGDSHLAHHRATHNLRLERQRYLSVQLKIPVIRFRPPAHSTTAERYPRLGRVTISLSINDIRAPFNKDYRCFVGSQWFAGNRKVAHHLLHPSEKDLRLRHYYRYRVVPDESYFQCAICNAGELTYLNKTFRFAIWNGAHPIELTDAHIGDMFASGAHFARKFGEDADVLNIIDEELGVNVKSCRCT